jgi:hypothetical protein
MAEVSFSALLTECDSIIKEPPTDVSVERFSALVQDPTLRQYAFYNLNNPSWIRPLHAKNFFSQPPPPIIDEDKRTISFPVWPESHFLARMAALEPSVVLDVILEVPSTDNINVHADLIRAALAMPSALSATWSEKEVAWLDQQSFVGGSLGQDFGSLISHLARGNQQDVALTVARSVLTVMPDPRAAEKIKEEGAFSFPLEPRTRVELIWYESILKKNIPDLVSAAGASALTLLSDLLERAIELSRSNVEGEGPEDFSYIWRSWIQDIQNYGIKDVLVSAVRDASEQLARNDPTQVPSLVRELEARRWRVFQRIALHLLQVSPTHAAELIAARLTDESLFGEDGVRNEYASLLRTHFGTLSPEQQQVFIRWVEKGPGDTPEEYKDSVEHWFGKRPTEQEYERYVKSWKRDRLEPVHQALPPEWRRLYDELIEELGQPEPIESGPYLAADVVMEKSPKSLEDFRSMSVGEIVTYLETWRPSDSTEGISRAGLASTLTGLVSSNPELFSSEARVFQGLNSAYLAAFISGIRQAVEKESLITWEPVLEICHTIANQPRIPLEGETESARRRSDEVALRRHICSLLLAGFKHKPTEIPSNLRTLAWESLRPLTDDPDPTPEYETQYGGSNMDPATLSLNTLRGESMHGVVQYALWVRRNIEKAEDASVRLKQGFEEMPEVREVLDHHLDPGIDPALSIRAVYGQWFPWLLLIDESWAANNVPNVFPEDERLSDLRDAAWQTYIIFCAPYDAVFEVLRGEYRRAVERIGTGPKWRALYAKPDERLAEHLMTLYWRGKLELTDPEGLLFRFFDIAPDKLLGHAIGFVGRSLHNTKEDIPPRIIERLRMLWSLRLDAARHAAPPSSHAGELAEFGWWFTSEKFDEEWATTQLDNVLHITGDVEPDHLVVEHLAKLAPSMPIAAANCLNLIIKGAREPWSVYGYQDPARAIIATAIKSGDVTAREIAEDAVSRLMAKGHMGFRDLLPSDRH